MGGSWSSERGVKRPHGAIEATEKTADGEQGDASSELNTPKRKRFKSTALYIVRKLFEEGTDSDVSIIALGKTWQLHRLYLSQCPYFDSMFNREWAETGQQEISLEITDNNISVEALRIAFRSLYTDSILVKPLQVIEVLAAASFLQLEPLIDHCRQVMKDSIMCQSVCCYLTATDRYGLGDVQELCWTWLLRNLMILKHATMLSDVSEELLSSLLDTRDLWMMQVEVDVYCLLKKWVFCQLHPSWSGNNEQLHKDTAQFFKQNTKDKGCCFLQTAEGSTFVPLFLKVRWMYVINDSACIQSLIDDNVVPIGWLDEVFRFCWTSHLRAEQSIDLGPSDMSEDDFHRWAMRCGRLLHLEQEYHWRWLGYSYGLDLLFTLRNKVLTIRRNCGSSQHYPGSLSQQEERRVKVKVKVTSVRKKGTGAVLDSGVKTLTLRKEGTECVLLSLPLSTTFPLQVTMHLLYLAPPPSHPALPTLLLPPTPLHCVPSPLPSGQGSEVKEQASEVGSGDRKCGATKFHKTGNNTAASTAGSTIASSRGKACAANSMNTNCGPGISGNVSTASSEEQSSDDGCLRKNTVKNSAASSSCVNTQNSSASSFVNKATANNNYAASSSGAVNSSASSFVNNATANNNYAASSSGAVNSSASSFVNNAAANSRYAASSSGAVNSSASSSCVNTQNSSASSFVNNAAANSRYAASSSGVVNSSASSFVNNGTANNNYAASSSCAVNSSASSFVNNATANSRYAASSSGAVNMEKTSTASNAENSVACSSGSGSTASSIWKKSASRSNRATASSSAETMEISSSASRIMNDATSNNYAAGSSSAVDTTAMNIDEI